MDKDELKGEGKQAEGKAREMAGKVTGNEDQEAEGRAKQAEGKAQETLGEVKDKVKDFGRKVTGD